MIPPAPPAPSPAAFPPEVEAVLPPRKVGAATGQQTLAETLPEEFFAAVEHALGKIAVWVIREIATRVLSVLPPA